MHIFFLSGVLYLTDIMLSWTLKSTYYMIPFKLSRTGKINLHLKKIEYFLLQGWGMWLTLRGHGETLWGGRNVLYLNQSMSCMGVSMNQSIQLRFFRKWCSLSFTHLQSSLGPSHSFFPLCFPQFMLPIPSQACSWWHSPSGQGLTFQELSAVSVWDGPLPDPPCSILPNSRTALMLLLSYVLHSHMF